MVRSVMELKCMVAVTKYTSTISYFHGVTAVNYGSNQSSRVADTLD